jgi:hypothetical protein
MGFNYFVNWIRAFLRPRQNLMKRWLIFSCPFLSVMMLSRLLTRLWRGEALAGNGHRLRAATRASKASKREHMTTREEASIPNMHGLVGVKAIGLNYDKLKRHWSIN